MAQITQQNNIWHLQGELVVEDIVQVLDATGPLEMNNQTVLDFAQVTEVDTSAVSFILELKRRAKQKNVKIGLKNLPANMISLMQLYGVDGFVQEASSAT